MNDMNNNTDNFTRTSEDQEMLTPADLLTMERSLRAAGLVARAGATSERLDRVAQVTWKASAGHVMDDAPAAPLVFVAPRQAVFTPMRVAAMLAIGAGVIASVLALQTTPTREARVIARSETATPTVQTPAQTPDELVMFDTYLASADASRSGIDAFVEDASDLQDRFDALSTGEDWWSDTDASVTQGAS
jgi:hypothetical protein